MIRAINILIKILLVPILEFLFEKIALVWKFEIKTAISSLLTSYLHFLSQGWQDLYDGLLILFLGT